MARGYLIDTNVISELRRRQPEPRVVEWFDQRPARVMYLSVLSPQGHLGVEVIGEHALVVAHQVVVDLGVSDGEAGNLCHVGIAVGIESGPHDVDDLDAALIPRPGLEQLLHDLESFFDLGGISPGAVAAQQELHH
jgi:hypothetical protein